METKFCTSCGVDKPLSSFRHYYAGRKGTYRYCKSCERIENRRKRLVAKPELTDAEQHELDSINELYAFRAANGLKPLFGCSKDDTITELIQQELAKVKDQAN